ncbi:HNH endonuclease signature motif containing protein [Fructobacillus fructosus]|uniref:HNH endonuclease signature motif containing protein n=1 Tax=Fructobacillus fructosus TaxID=1631 RepID=UPI002009E678|nr:HNH endonuclease signature motif containing protein [Fructobacillus fructosus]MCK8638989.1 HNH endonuclease [Fructobacillus fructosus]
MKTECAHIEVKNQFQKRDETYQDILTDDILEDLVFKVTGQKDYDINFIETEKNAKGKEVSTYNKGRLVVIKYDGMTNYISLSDNASEGRNSFFQSFTTALVLFSEEKAMNKRLCFYFLPQVSKSSIETSYHMMMYRLMLTSGTHFLNADEALSKDIVAFSTVDDFVNYRSKVLKKKQNNSSYATIDNDGNTIIYGKVYGASKKEVTLIALAMSKLNNKATILYEFIEKNLKQLPKPDLKLLKKSGIKVVRKDQELEKQEFEKNDSLRSPAYIANLLEKMGPKHCAFCDCDIPQLIQGAHIFPVADIKKLEISLEEKIAMATDGDNGLWLCNNHHKMLDSGILSLDDNGRVARTPLSLEKTSEEFVASSITSKQIPANFMSEKFKNYLGKRLAS